MRGVQSTPQAHPKLGKKLESVIPFSGNSRHNSLIASAGIVSLQS